VIDTIGFLELNSISKGVEAADAMLKKADVDLIFAKPGCPGKYYVLIAGETAEVRTAVSAGIETGEGWVIESLVLPRVHQQVLEAINLCVPLQQRNAVGLMEFFSVTQALICGDIAVKAANITLIDIRLGTGIGGKSYVILTGDTAAVSQAIAAGTDGAKDNGLLINKVVISNPDPALFDSFY
jgi:microcompartment protein CcmL/EutN